jgi:hypothetical protein
MIYIVLCVLMRELQYYISPLVVGSSLHTHAHNDNKKTCLCGGGGGGNTPQ